MLRRFTVSICSVLLCVLLVACGAGSSARGYNSVYNTELGHVVRLGMTKDDIDELCGEGEKGLIYYKYIDGLSIEYKDGKANLIVLDGYGCDWVAYGDIGISSNIDAVFSAYGESEITDIATLGDGTIGSGYIVQYYCDVRGNKCDVADAEGSISIWLEEDKSTVKMVRISSK